MFTSACTGSPSASRAFVVVRVACPFAVTVAVSIPGTDFTRIVGGVPHRHRRAVSMFTHGSAS
jgi:hypothetical protein